MRLKFQILDNEYSQTAARATCSQILGKYNIREKLMDDDYRFIKAAFQNHHYEKERKFPSPIVEIVVVQSESGSNKEFEFVLQNMTIVRAGISKCFLTENGRKKTATKNIKDAVRQTVRHQQDEMRYLCRKQDQVVCSLCGEVILDPLNDLHADHAGEFEFNAILSLWLEEMGIDILSIETEDVPGFGSVRQFRDQQLAEKWICFHKKKFRPMPAHAKCNLMKNKKV